MSGGRAEATAPPIVWAQAIALLAAWWLFESRPLVEAVILVWALGFSHYLLGAIYSRRHITALCHPGPHLAGLAGLALLGTGLYLGNLSLILFFGLHHALNEAYISGRLVRYRETSSWLPCTSFVLHITGYLLISYDDTLQAWPVLHVCMGVGFYFVLGLFLAQLYRTRGSIENRAWLPALFSEIVLAVLVPLDLVAYDINPYQVVLYHFVFWALYPMPRLATAGTGRALPTYLVLTVASLWLFIAMAPAANVTAFSRHTGAGNYQYWFIVLSFVHITLSFAISRTNPAWINRLFAPSP